MRYPLVHNKVLRLYLYIFDFFCWILKKIFPKSARPVEEIDFKKIQRILLRNPAAFGDVLFSLRVASALKCRYPHLEIGMMAGAWTIPLLRACPAISFMHFENHWAMRATGGKFPTRLLKYLRSWSGLRRGLISQKYDAAVDLYYYFPSAAFLFWSADIPVRVGYGISGGSALLTHVEKWELKDQHNIEYQARLLQNLGCTLPEIHSITNVFNFEHPDDLLLKKYDLEDVKYAIFHIGKSEPRCEWNIERWVDVARFVEEEGITICFTGKGEREQGGIYYVMKRLKKKHISLCNLLNITELMQVIRSSYFFVGVDSFAGHIAALYQVPQIAIMHGAANRYHWQPYHNKNCQVVCRLIECAPCYDLARCERGNICMDILSDDVIAVIKNYELLGENDEK